MDRAPKRSPLTDRFAMYEVRPLDLAAMQEAALGLVGNHDFATFGQPPQGESTVRTVHVAEWQVVAESLSDVGGLSKSAVGVHDHSQRVSAPDGAQHRRQLVGGGTWRVDSGRHRERAPSSQPPDVVHRRPRLRG